MNEMAKIHGEDHSVEDHSIFDEESGQRTPLSLNGIFSAFKIRSLSENKIEDIGIYQMIFIIPYST